MVDTEIDYKNDLTNMTIKVSGRVNEVLKKSIELMLRGINKMVSEE